jgi:hypothetical protein
MEGFYACELSDKTRRLYNRNLQTLNDEIVPSSLSFLSDVDLIIRKLEPYCPNTKRTYLISILSALRHSDKKKYAEYYPHMVSLTNDLRIPTISGKPMSFSDVMEIKNHTLKFLTKPVQTTRDYDKLLDLVILSIFALQPPFKTKDCLDMCVGDGRPSTDGVTFYVDDGDEPIVDELKPVIDLYLEARPKTSSKFLVRHNGQELKTTTDLTRRISKILGTKISIASLRKLKML